MNPLCCISEDHIRNLNANQLAELLSKLLHLEARKNSLPLSGVRVPLCIAVSDDGEDACIEWSDGPERTDYVPKRLTMFQSKAKDMGPSACKQEVEVSPGVLKSRVKEVLENGGAYTVFCNRKCSGKMVRKRIEKIKEALAEASLPSSDSRTVDFYGASLIVNWAMLYPAAAAYVLECNGIARPSGLRPWASWAKDEDCQGTYTPNRFLAESIDNLRKRISQPRTVLRIEGLSWLGKTRLAFEAFRPPEDRSDVRQQSLSDSVVYFDASLSSAVEGAADEFCERGMFATFVIDNCKPALHSRLKRTVMRIDSLLSLVTIGCHPEARHSDHVISLDRNQLRDVVKDMLKLKYPATPPQNLDRVASFAQGFPGVASLLGKRLEQGAADIGYLSDDEIVHKLLWGREDEKEDQREKAILQGCAVFEQVGFHDKLVHHRKFAAEEVCGVSEGEFHATCRKFIRRGIIDEQGHFICIVPKPLAIRLAAEWLENATSAKIQQVIQRSAEIGLSEALCAQMEYLNFTERAKQITERLVSENGPFGSAGALNAEGAARFFRSLAVVNPQATAATLVREFGSKSREDLLGIVEGRRNLIWALEKLCFWQETFPAAAGLMLAFAAAENEAWGNNATNQFLQLFHVFLPGTQAPLKERLDVIRSGLCSEAHEKRVLAVRGLGSALQTSHFTRMGGAEAQGSRAPQWDYRPKTSEEAHGYRDECLRLLKDVACSDPELSELARHELAQNLPGMIRVGHMGVIEDAIKEIADKTGGYWPEALQVIRLLIRSHKSGLHKDALGRLEEWCEWLAPESLANRLRLVVCDAPSDIVEEEDGKYMDRARTRARVLAEELAADPSWQDHLPLLLRGRQSQAHEFGRRLGELSANPAAFVSLALDILSSCPAEEANPTVLGAFLASIEDRELVRQTLRKVSQTEELVRHAIPLVRLVRPDLDALDLALSVVRSGKVPLGELASFQYGSVLEHLSAEDITEFCRRVAGFGIDGARCAFGILYMRTTFDKATWEKCAPYARELAVREALLDFREGEYQLDLSQWQDTMTKLLSRSKNDGPLARRVATEIVRACRTDIRAHQYDYAFVPLLVALLQDYRDSVWPIISGGLLRDTGLCRHNLGSLLSSSRSHVPNALLVLSTEFLVQWCTDNDPEAPVILARICPAFSEDGKWPPLARAVIDGFGSNEAVLSQMAANLGSFGWTGSLVPRYKAQAEMMKRILGHPIPKVREWAARQLEWAKREMREQRLDDEDLLLGMG